MARIQTHWAPAHGTLQRGRPGCRPSWSPSPCTGSHSGALVSQGQLLWAGSCLLPAGHPWGCSPSCRPQLLHVSRYPSAQGRARENLMWCHPCMCTRIFARLRALPQLGVHVSPSSLSKGLSTQAPPHTCTPQVPSPPLTLRVPGRPLCSSALVGRDPILTQARPPLVCLPTLSLLLQHSVCSSAMSPSWPAAPPLCLAHSGASLGTYVPDGPRCTCWPLLAPLMLPYQSRQAWPACAPQQPSPDGAAQGLHPTS